MKRKVSNTQHSQGLYDDLQQERYFIDDHPTHASLPPTHASLPPAPASLPPEPACPDEVDPLDEYMLNLEENVQKAMSTRGERLVQEDPMDHYLDHIKDIRSKTQQPPLDSDEDIQAPHKLKKKGYQVLPTPVPMPTRQLIYDNYIQHQDIINLSTDNLQTIISTAGIQVTPQEQDIRERPIVSWGHLCLVDQLSSYLARKEFSCPTPIQQQAVVLGLMGLDVTGVAGTGSGKTMAFLIPLVAHILKNKTRDNHDPLGVVVCPTRELAQQVGAQLKALAKTVRLRIVSLTGGEDKQQQWKDLRKGCEAVVATPGRLVELVSQGALDIRQVGYVVVDECDKMVSMGFSAQVGSIVKYTRTDRQLLLFTATLPPATQQTLQAWRGTASRGHRLVKVGSLSQGGVIQEFKVMDSQTEKDFWLQGQLATWVRGEDKKVLLFANQVKTVQCLTDSLQAYFRQLHQQAEQNIQQQTLLQQVRCPMMALPNYQPQPYMPRVTCLHGDMHQWERNENMSRFRQKGGGLVMVSTDVASRGLDVKDIDVVVNYENSPRLDTHTHRIGRTGRAGQTGLAVTLLLAGHDGLFLQRLVQYHHKQGLSLPPSLLPFDQDQYQQQLKAFKSNIDESRQKDYKQASVLLNQSLHQGQTTQKGLGFVAPSKNQQPAAPSLKQQLASQAQDQFLLNRQFNQQLDSSLNQPLDSSHRVSKFRSVQEMQAQLFKQESERELIQRSFQRQVVQTVRNKFKCNFVKSETPQDEKIESQKVQVRFGKEDETQQQSLAQDMAQYQEAREQVLNRNSPIRKSRSRSHERRVRRSGWDT